jgi:hypothetical protein
MNRGPITLILLTLVFLAFETDFYYELDSWDAIGPVFGIGKPIFFLLFIFLFSRKLIWARWVLSIALFLYGLMCFFLANQVPIYSLYLVGAFDLFFAIVIHRLNALAIYRG